MDWRKVVVLTVLINYQVSGYRLPNSVVPVNYNMKIITYLDEPVEPKFSYAGSSVILIKCLERTKNITLHSLNLNISKKVVMQVSNNKMLHIHKIYTDEQYEFLIIQLSTYLEKGEKYELILNYEGKLTEGLIGYYRSSYIDKKTQKRHWLAVTDFEPTDARRAFPCFDEPNLKATFEITLGRRRDFSTLSNMPLLRTEAMSKTHGWFWDFYPKSLRMSTYLVAYAVLDFHYISSKTKNNVSVNIWARKEAINQAVFASGVGVKSLAFYEYFFNVRYPLPKQDMIAIPDFNAGAMENWGAVTYRETTLLVDSNLSSLLNLHDVAYVIAHEMAHQWFGNLVTMKWWSDLWLNEGFATYMGTVCVTNMFPLWNYASEHFGKQLQVVFDLDSLESSHKISVPVYNPAEIIEIFDIISYKKGSSVIRMMSHFLGSDVFRHGITSYLKKYAYGNADQDDLWHSLSEEAHKEHTLSNNVSVKQIMESWTLQVGFPVLNIHRNYATGRITITQERFYKDMSIENDPANTCWWIPLSYTTEDEANFMNTMPKIWLTCPKFKYFLNGPSPNKWIIFNIRATGVYIVNYDDRTWMQLAKFLKYGNRLAISEINRFLLIDNAFRLAWTGALSYEIAFDLISYIKAETAYLPWKVALGMLDKTAVMLSRTFIYGNIKTFIKNLVTPIYNKLGGLLITPEKRLKTNILQHQMLITEAACYYGIEKCIHEAIILFQREKNHSYITNSISVIPSEIKLTIYCTAIKYGPHEDWDFLWERYKKSNLGLEKSDILWALGCTQEIWLLNRYLEWTVKENSEIRAQDILRVLRSISKSNVGYFVLQTFLENRVKDLANRFSPNEYRLGQVLKDLAVHVSTFPEMKRLEDLVKKYKSIFSKSKINVKQALETARINVRWHKFIYKQVDKVLEDIYPNKDKKHKRGSGPC